MRAELEKMHLLKCAQLQLPLQLKERETMHDHKSDMLDQSAGPKQLIIESRRRTMMCRREQRLNNEILPKPHDDCTERQRPQNERDKLVCATDARRREKERFRCAQTMQSSTVARAERSGECCAVVARGQ